MGVKIPGSLVQILCVSMLVLAACTSDAASEGAENTAATGETITVADAEERVREIVSLDGQEVRSTLLVNSEDALESLQEIAPEVITQKAEVGDFFIVFSEMQVIYRPSTDLVVQTVPIVKGTPETAAAPSETSTP